jgi:AcrR family transcriptional regulator
LKVALASVLCQFAARPEEFVLTARNPTAAPPTRISQRDRRQAAERKLMDATVSILVERGYAATTTLEVQKQAGVSRGVLLHYFGSRGELISAAARHLYATKIGEVRLRATEALNGQDWASLLWQVISGPLGGASLELLIAARHDPDMREYIKPLEREFGRANFEMCKALLGEQRAAHKGFTDFCVVVINSMLGAAASAPGHGTTEEKRLLEVWRRMPDLYFAPETSDV